MRYLLLGMLISIAMASCTQALAHEMTPTYPIMERSHIDGIYKTKITMFNKRNDVEFYEIGVFDKDFNKIPFVTSYKVIKLKYLDHINFDIYIRADDLDKATYICSRSKLRKDASSRTAISSRICSKVKR